tara:strand:+ start:862 stop:1404 length:543 start_codon:yes stop_codon:yes gene_type:complete
MAISKINTGLNNPLASSTLSSAAASIEVSLGSTTAAIFDYYHVYFTLTPATNNVTVQARFLNVSGAERNGSVYAGGTINESGGSDSSTNGATQMDLASNQGSASQEAVTGFAVIGNMNDTNHPCFMSGFLNGTNENGNHQCRVFNYSIIKGSFAVNTGLKLFFSSGNVSAGTLAIYGVSK